MTDDLRMAVARALCLSFYGTQWEAMPAFIRGICYDMADAALAALGIPLAALERLRSGASVEVPAEATQEMESKARALDWTAETDPEWRDYYRAMLAARPNATEAGHE